MITDHVKETVPGIIGNCAVGVAGIVAWITADGLPILQAVSLLCGILVALATAGYYFVMWRRVRRKEEAEAARRRRAKSKR
jgi:hypothetical protein